MKAGANALTRIPRLANSSAAVLVKPSTACLLAFELLVIFFSGRCYVPLMSPTPGSCLI
jgi:hypothetical protein